MQRNMVLIGLFALAVNAQFHYPKCFSMVPTGQIVLTPKEYLVGTAPSSIPT